MKIHILYPFVKGPWGGANQFLKAIRTYFVRNDCYVENVDEADIILFNSSPLALVSNIMKLYKYKRKFPEKIFINRIDGPVYYIRQRNVFIDKAFYEFNKKFCEGTIFQSNWSRKKNYSLGLKNNEYEKVIINAPNPSLFNTDGRINFNGKEKIKIIATSWSSNKNKGFDIYKWLDDNIDFKRYQMTFVGNSQLSFKNIICKEAMNSFDLSKELKSNHIYITASKNDPCSNSLIEALHCGLPAIVYNHGGHPELIGDGGEVFNSKEEILFLLEKIRAKYSLYCQNISKPNINDIGKQYKLFFEDLYKKKSLEILKLKKVKFFDLFSIYYFIYKWKINEFLIFIIHSVHNKRKKN